MLFVDIIVNIRINTYNQNAFTYSVPEQFCSQIQLGKRVLIPWGNKTQKGWIVGINENPGNDITAKPIIRVLDNEPILNQEIVELGRWVADYYCSDLHKVMNTIIPPLFNQHHKQTVLLTNTDNEQLLQLFAASLPTSLLNETLDRGEIHLKTLKKYLSAEIIESLLENRDLIEVGYYSGYRRNFEDLYYQLSDFVEEGLLTKLEKSAPRQAEAVRILQAERAVPAAIMHKSVTAAALSALMKKNIVTLVKNPFLEQAKQWVLNQEQQLAFEAISNAIDSESFYELLLWGVTGSGKTEVYIHSAKYALSKGKSVLFLVPEIALTSHLVDSLKSHFTQMAVMHSRISASKRAQQWLEIAQGEINFVLGTRMAVFAPLKNLGLIIVDEEQENTYKQESDPRYNARDVAKKRAELGRAVFLAGSATPSLETFKAIGPHTKNTLRLPGRIAESRLADVTIVDLKKIKPASNTNIITPLLYDSIKDRLIKQEQTIIFVHRRGHSSMIICRNCGSIAVCKYCSVSLTYHHDKNAYICHYCGYSAIAFDSCQNCGSKFLQRIGYGTQKVEEEIRLLFPDARVARMDLDSSRKNDWQQNVIAKMHSKQLDILIGTQMVAKGLDFPSVSLVGIVDADSILNLPDFRAGERCFQLIVQAAGRAGRSPLTGQVIVQSYYPESQIIQFAAAQDYKAFACHELNERRNLHYPPFTKLLRFVVSSSNENETEVTVENIAEEIREILDANESDFVILGPAPCSIGKINNYFRWQIIIKSKSSELLSSIGKHIITKRKQYGARIEVDIDPIMTM